jgi:hypothetical protein
MFNECPDTRGQRASNQSDYHNHVVCKLEWRPGLSHPPTKHILKHTVLISIRMTTPQIDFEGSATSTGWMLESLVVATYGTWVCGGSIQYPMYHRLNQRFQHLACRFGRSFEIDLWCGDPHFNCHCRFQYVCFARGGDGPGLHSNMYST